MVTVFELSLPNELVTSPRAKTNEAAQNSCLTHKYKTITPKVTQAMVYALVSV